MAEPHDRLQVLAAAYQDAARPPGPAAARRRGRQRRRHQAGGAGLLALALLAAGVTLGSQLLQEPRAATAAAGGGDQALEAIPPEKDVVDGYNQRTGPIQLVTRGVAGRSGWKLATYPSGERTCSVVIGDGDAAGYGCGFDVPGRRPLMAVWSTIPGGMDGGIFVDGQVVQEAARVRIELSNHAPSIELPALSAPDDVGVRFFAASLRLPVGARPTATVALDEHGRELGRQTHRFAVMEGGG
jgi:hypothetical protein